MNRRLMAAAFAVAVLGGSFAGALPGNAKGTDRDRGTNDFLTAAGSLGPRPSTLIYSVMLPPPDDSRVHVNAKITCDGEHNGDHLHIHWGSLQFKATVMEGADCSGEDKSGDAEGTVMGMCNGVPAMASFFFSTEDEPEPLPARAAFAQGGTAEVDVSGGCEIEGEPPFQGSIKFHDQTKDEDTSSDR